MRKSKYSKSPLEFVFEQPWSCSAGKAQNEKRPAGKSSGACDGLKLEYSRDGLPGFHVIRGFAAAFDTIGSVRPHGYTAAIQNFIRI